MGAVVLELGAGAVGHVRRGKAVPRDASDEFVTPPLADEGVGGTRAWTENDDIV